MKKLKETDLLIIISVFSVMGCRKPYAPSIVSTGKSYLVVEGTINTGQDSTIISLSRTVNFADSVNRSVETKAQVEVESDQDTDYPLTEIGNGKYGAYALNLDVTHKYHLKIKLASGRQYLSDPEPVITNPPIDSVGYNLQGDGITLYVNNHNPQNSTHYYRWAYQETWQFHAEFESDFRTDGREIVFRPQSQQVYSCFGNNTSNVIVLASTANLSQNEVYQNTLLQIKSSAERIETKYSILVKQYALTPDEFTFYQNLKKNTEQLGSIFDPQPSTIDGNIHSVDDPTEPVLGYIGVNDNTSQKRIFISRSELPKTWTTQYPYQCEEDSVKFSQVDVDLVPLNSPRIPTHYIYSTDPANAGPIGYFATAPLCADCTLRGTTKQPDFWK